MSKETFIQTINPAYQFSGSSIVLGCAMLDKQAVPEAVIRIPLKTMNRHGLIAGATGTGKTKTLQVIAEQLSKQGVPSLLLDIKGDLSGIAAEGSINSKIADRHLLLNIPYTPSGNPVELLTISEQPGVRLRATVSEFGPVLFSKILGLNDTQESVIALVFKFCDDSGLPLLDLDDFKKVLQFVSNEGKEVIEKEFGTLSSTTVGTILRKIIELEQQGAAQFFGEHSFDVKDLCRIDEDGRAMISILRVTDIQDKPKFFSSFLLQMLAEVYAQFPEAGDLEKPKLVMFLDEAHLLFEEATDALMDQLETIIKLIRSKGIGIFFITQNPIDIPDTILAQLGLKVQHALRAFTAKDRKAINMAAENYPETEFYDVSQLITELGIGEAFVTALNEKGIPTPLAHTLLRAPESRMDVLTEQEMMHIIRQSDIVDHYNEVVNRESAYEILTAKLNEAESQHEDKRTQWEEAAEQGGRKKEKSMLEKVMGSSVTRSIGSTVARELTRGLLGVFGIKTTQRRRTPTRKKFSWF